MTLFMPLQVAQDPPGLPPGQQGLGVPEVRTLGRQEQRKYLKPVETGPNVAGGKNWLSVMMEEMMNVWDDSHWEFFPLCCIRTTFFAKNIS